MYNLNIYINAPLIEECRKSNNKAQYSLYNQYSKAMFNLAYRILNNREATPLLTKNPEIKKELNTDLSQLDSICSDLKKDLNRYCFKPGGSGSIDSELQNKNPPS